MSGTRLRSSVVLLALVACACSATTRGIGADPDTVVPMVEGETMHGALTRAGVPASFIRIEGAGHGFEVADLQRANAATVQWFERHLGSAAM